MKLCNKLLAPARLPSLYIKVKAPHKHVTISYRYRIDIGKGD